MPHWLEKCVNSFFRYQVNQSGISLRLLFGCYLKTWYLCKCPVVSHFVPWSDSMWSFDSSWVVCIICQTYLSFSWGCWLGSCVLPVLCAVPSLLTRNIWVDDNLRGLRILLLVVLTWIVWCRSTRANISIHSGRNSTVFEVYTMRRGYRFRASKADGEHSPTSPTGFVGFTGLSSLDRVGSFIFFHVLTLLGLSQQRCLLLILVCALIIVMSVDQFIWQVCWV